MKNSFADKVYEFVNHIIHGTGHGTRVCPVTGLDISMQPRNSKFLSYTGVKWYYDHNRKVFDKYLLSRLTDHFKNDGPDIQFREIAHSIRNSDSNPRNNSRRAIRRLLDNSDNTLFNNLDLIDKSKLENAGF